MFKIDNVGEIAIQQIAKYCIICMWSKINNIFILEIIMAQEKFSNVLLDGLDMRCSHRVEISFATSSGTCIKSSFHFDFSHKFQKVAHRF